MRPRFFNLSRRHQAGLPAPLRQAQQTRLGTARKPGHQALAVVGWLVLCLAASGTAIFVSTGGWYAGLQKPSWNPPPWVFGPVWTLLYIMMAAAAWLVWREGGWKERSWDLRLFLLQWVLNVLWTPLFFGMHRSGFAFAEIVALWFALTATLVSFWRVKKAAGVLLAAYLAWVSFAAALNFTIWYMNS
jgi:tryptophan-rich sensory protein